jgi:hypothetical protein
MLSGTNFRYVTGANRTRLRVAIAGSGPLVLMVHGFPESWFSWRHQMPAIAAAGFTAAPSMSAAMAGPTNPTRSKPIRSKNARRKGRSRLHLNGGPKTGRFPYRLGRSNAARRCAGHYQHPITDRARA